tara:strand:+ start:187 stop:633 length:447 start_codon:yes stop_codon:yes gene_type:complete
MHRSKAQRILEGQIFVTRSLEMFMSGKGDLLYHDPKVFFIGFNAKDKKIMKEKVVRKPILHQITQTCPLFTNASTANLIHVHNFGVSLVAKYSSEIFVKKLEIEDRRSVMEWARENCEICDTRTSEFQQRSAAITKNNIFGNVIAVDF